MKVLLDLGEISKVTGSTQSTNVGDPAVVILSGRHYPGSD